MDVRLGRWLSVDPLQKKHEGESPYMYCGNSPIIYADPDGKDRIITTYGIFNGKTVLIGTVTVKGDHTWGYSNVNSNSHSMMHIVQTVTIDYDKQTPTSSTLTTVGGSYGKQYDDLSYLAERASEGIHSVVESARSTGTSYQEAGEVLVGGKGTTVEFGNKAGTITGVINLGPLLDAIKAFKPISPEFLKDNKVLEEASKAIGYSSKLASLLVNNVMQSAKYFAYTKDALTGATKIDDTQKAADPTIGKTDAGAGGKGKQGAIDTIPLTKKKRDDCTVCGSKKTDSNHVNKVARTINEQRKN